MKKPLLETFDNLNLTDRQARLFKDVVVSRVVVTRKTKNVEIYIESSHIIAYREIGLLEYALAGVLGRAGYKVKVYDRFNLSSQYTPGNFWEEYHDSILLILKEENILEFNMVYSGNVDVTGNIINISCEDDSMYRAREEELAEIISRIFSTKASFEISVNVNYTEPVSINELPATGTYGMAEPVIYKAKSAGSNVQQDNVNPEDNYYAKVAGTNNNSKGYNKKYNGQQKGRYKGQGSYKGADEECFYGRNCDGDIIKIADIQGEVGEVVIEGKVVSTEEREIKNEKIIYMFNVTDFTDTIQAKIFIPKEEAGTVRDNIKAGKFIKLKGVPLYDTFSREITISSIRGIKPGIDKRVKRMDNYQGMKRVELHAHTQMSEMDSVMSIGDYVNTAKRWGHRAMAITDHGVVQSFPDADHALKPGDDLKIIYGVEAYLVDDLIDTVINSKGQDFTGEFVVFDLETTGIGAASNEIIEIGAVKVINNVITDKFSTFVNPGRPVPYNIQELTGINDQMVSDAPSIDKVLPGFLEFCGNAVLVAHNASFDTGFIFQKAKDRGIHTDFTVIDTVAMSRALLPELKKYKLDTVAKTLGVSLENHHRAVDDAGATAEIFVKLVKRLEDKGITTLEGLNEFGRPGDETIRKLPSYHAVILAKNETGRVNLYRLVSESHLRYFNRRPKLPKSLYMQYSEGLMIGSACEAGELYRAIL